MHLVPAVGHKRLDAIKSEDVQHLKGRLSTKAAKTVNNILTVRHTFCSHLAMRGAPPRAIQELGGHRELGMTQRYMHLTPAALDSAIRLLDQPLAVQSFGDILETGRVSPRKDQWLENLTGGEAGIRTLDTGFGPYNGLANRRLQPLGHLTATRFLSILRTETCTLRATGRGRRVHRDSIARLIRGTS